MKSRSTRSFIFNCHNSREIETFLNLLVRSFDCAEYRSAQDSRRSFIFNCHNSREIEPFINFPARSFGFGGVPPSLRI
jgi:hypothetical protein